jgi:hypothetical protein
MAKSPFDYWLSGFAVFCMVLGALIGGAVAAMVLELGSSLPEAIKASPLFLAWTTLITAEGAISWAGAMPAAAAAWYAGKAIRRADVKDAPARNFKWIALTVLAIFAVLTAAVLFEPRATPLDVHWPLGEEHRTRVALMTGFVLLPPLVAVVAMWLLAICAVYESRRSVEKKTLVTTHLELRGRVQGLLWYLGVVIGGGVLATGTLRHAMLEAGYATDKHFPQSLVLAYGAFFTLLLVICYVPTHLMVEHAGKRILDAVLPDEPAATILDWQKSRKELLQLLHLDTALQDSLKNTIAILAPILAGLASMALPK